ncbi:hypothetical protein BOX15_Mlig020450g2 [Macrostomum lignano]|uniref:Ras-related C3 botulinum toxin substrate 1 n=1 Tax=Macrostomum lignano TaxID=282301 RepID=A0A267G5L4_9PLAT|nr:hypothetical protein BOX15_Mlig020450g2 [Macrostomum lignano]
MSNNANSSNRVDTLKVVLVGDGSVGKTCMLSVYMKKGFPTTYVPTIVDNFSYDVTVDSRPVRLQLWDTAGQEDYDRLRPLSYPNTDVFVVCFSVDGRNSFKNVRDKWRPELGHYGPSVPIILVATKADLRTDSAAIDYLKRQNITMVDSSEGRAMATEIGAKTYVECSALTGHGLQQVMEEAVRAHLMAKGICGKKKKNNKTRPCTLL